MSCMGGQDGPEVLGVVRVALARRQVRPAVAAVAAVAAAVAAAARAPGRARREVT